jgi:hypothetical protein
MKLFPMIWSTIDQPPDTDSTKLQFTQPFVLRPVALVLWYVMLFVCLKKLDMSFVLFIYSGRPVTGRQGGRLQKPHSIKSTIQ